MIVVQKFINGLITITMKSNINFKKMEDSQNIGVVYDISLDGTVVNALGMNVMSNTDG